METPRRIFISYSRKDKGRVYGLGSLLEALGHEVFIDNKSIRAGTLWKEELKKALDNHDSLIVFWTRYAKKSDWVRYEVEYFNLREDAQIMPIKGDETPLLPLLEDYQSVDFASLISELLDIKQNLEEVGATHRQIEKAILKRLEEAGIVLNSRQRRRVFAFIAPFGPLSWLTSPILTITGLWALLKTTVGQFLSIHIGTALSIVLVSTILCKTVDVSSAITWIDETLSGRGTGEIIEGFVEKPVDDSGKGSDDNLGKGTDNDLGEGTDNDPGEGFDDDPGEGFDDDPGEGFDDDPGEGFDDDPGEGFDDDPGEGFDDEKPDDKCDDKTWTKKTIEQVQQDLNQCLNLNLSEDGVIGQKTIKAIKKYAEIKDLKQGCVFTQNIIDLLSKDSETPSREPCSISGQIFKPSLSLRTEPSSRKVNAGDKFTINWTTEHAETVKMNGFKLNAEGAWTFYPTRTTIFKFVASSGAGDQEESVTVTVEPIPEPSLRITTEPSSRKVNAGDKFTINWTIEHADTVTINGNEVSAEGVQTLNPEATTTYEFVATSKTGNSKRRIGDSYCGTDTRAIIKDNN